MKIYYIIFFVIYLSSCMESTINDSVTDLLILEDNTMIISSSTGGIEISRNEGHTWVKQSNFSFKKITIDSNKTIWGIDAWQGIHEKGYSRLFFSNDTGKTWKEFNFNIDLFFPINIISEPYNNLKIITNSNKTYELPYNKSLYEWYLRDSTKPLINSNNYSLTDESVLIVNDNGVKKNIIKITDISTQFGILDVNDSVYVAGGGRDNKAYFSLIVGDSVVKRYKIGGEQALGIRKNNKSRLFVYGNEGVFILEGNKLKKIH